MSEADPVAFRPTRWSLVVEAQGSGEPAKRALEKLCQDYWFPLYSWCRRFGIAAEDAEDYVQGFFVQVLEKEIFAAADPNLGKLRTFMLTAFRRYVKDEKQKQFRQKRGGAKLVSFDAMEAESWYASELLENETADHMFDRQWALTVLDNAMGKLEQHAIAQGKGDNFAVMRPFLSGEVDHEDYERAGKQIGKSANTVRVATHRLRLRFGEALRREIADTQPDNNQVDEEMTYLMEVLRVS